MGVAGNWGDSACSGAIGIWEISVPSSSILLWTLNFYEKKKTLIKKRNKMNSTFTLITWILLCWIALPVVYYTQWNCAKLIELCSKRWQSSYNWKMQATWLEPWCFVHTLVTTSVAMTPAACSCSGNAFHFPRFSTCL